KWLLRLRQFVKPLQKCSLSCLDQSFPQGWDGKDLARWAPEDFGRAAHPGGWGLLNSYLEVVTSLPAGDAARCSARLSCSTCWVHSAISSSISLISRAR